MTHKNLVLTNIILALFVFLTIFVLNYSSGTLSPALGVPQQPSHYHPFMRQTGPVIVPSPYAPQTSLVGPFTPPFMPKFDCMVSL